MLYPDKITKISLEIVVILSVTTDLTHSKLSLMVKELSLGTSLEDLEKKSENVTIDEKSDEKTLVLSLKCYVVCN